MNNSSNAINNPLSFETPDCIRCLRKKLNALGVAAFYMKDGEWMLSDFESDIPREDAEFQGTYLLKIGLPQIIANAENGLLLTGTESIQNSIPGINSLMNGTSIIGARTVFAGLGGVRFAWREDSQPFSSDELKILECFGECPPGCGV
ncbi:MAG: hypothetical protein GYA55_02450 [SAR324 cluster bacterium]|uniref:Uncharacterized protein n=1 Tax=SAR324 cluster bacterium TaxID=2024889 RepID=A0A7X9IJF2_9DELT|nr:hypothetical protein [SAR324 cluster bacterium]